MRDSTAVAVQIFPELSSRKIQVVWPVRVLPHGLLCGHSSAAFVTITDVLVVIYFERNILIIWTRPLI